MRKKLFKGHSQSCSRYSYSLILWTRYIIDYFWCGGIIYRHTLLWTLTERLTSATTNGGPFSGSWTRGSSRCSQRRRGLAFSWKPRRKCLGCLSWTCSPRCTAPRHSLRCVVVCSPFRRFSVFVFILVCFIGDNFLFDPLYYMVWSIKSMYELVHSLLV